VLRRSSVPADDARPRAALEVFRVALGLGLTSFGGPVAHLGYFHREYVERRRWLSEAAYLELVALSQLLPGPASSQVGIGIGLLRAGWAGAVAAWLGFTLPSAVLLTVFALATADLDLAAMGWVHGLKLAAVAIVAAAILAMWRALAPDWPRRLLALASAAALLLLSTAALQVAVIGVGGVAGWWLLRGRTAAPQPAGALSPVSGRLGLVLVAVFFVLLVALPVAAAVTASPSIAVVESFYRAGALVFGGGHVVLPLLSESVVAPGWVDRDTFLAGYGAAQAVPGPLFAVAAHLGASLEPQPNGLLGAVVATVAIFLPSFLLVGAALPLWERLRRSSAVRGALAGASAAVIGLLIAALVDPLWISTVAHPADVGLAAAAFGVLVVLRAPPWAVVLVLAAAGQAMAIVGIG
jgi:chromate transporter